MARSGCEGGARHTLIRGRSVGLDPVEGPGDGLLPVAVFALAGGLVHGRVPLLGLGPVVPDVLLAGPEAGGQAGRVGRAERGGLGDDGADDRDVEDVRLELHEQLVAGHAAVHLQRGERHAGVGVHGVDDLAGLERRRLEHRAGQVTLVHVPGEADDGAARVRTPVRREQAGERGHEVGAAVVLHRAGVFLDLGRAGDHAEVVAQPLHQRTGDRDRTLQRVDRVVRADLVADRGEQAVAAHHPLRAGVEQHEVAGAVGVLGLAGGQACLAEGRRLLVAEDAGDGHAGQRAALADLPVLLRRGPDLRQHAQRDAHLGRDVRVPGQGLQVHQQRAGGVGRVGRVHAAVRAAGHVPQQPGVHVAEHQLARFGPRPRTVHIVQDPADLGAGEVGGQREAGLGTVALLASAERAEFGADAVGPGVLPDDRVVHRLAGRAVPHQRGFALVGDTDRDDLTRLQVGLGERARGDLAGVAPDLLGVVLDPACLGEDLLVFGLVDGNHVS